MEVSTVAECIKLGLLRKVKSDNEKSKKSIDLADRRLGEAKESINYPTFIHSIIGSYTSMFHIARALLYRDGIQEKSHFAIFIYLKEKYSNEIPLSVLNLINVYRVQRHEALYGLDFIPTKEDALSAVKDAEVFVSSIKSIIGKK